MIRLGLVLALFGFGSALLHFTSVQFRLLMWAEPMQPTLGIALGGAGVLLIVIRVATSKDSGGEAPAGPAYDQPPAAAPFAGQQSYGPPSGPQPAAPFAGQHSYGPPSGPQQFAPPAGPQQYGQPAPQGYGPPQGYPQNGEPPAFGPQGPQQRFGPRG